MYTIIDTIRHSRSWMSRHPELEDHPEGLLVILEPEEVSEVPDVRGMMARIERPDGSAIRLKIDGYEVKHQVVGVFFNGQRSEDIPRLSRIEWEQVTN